MRYRRARGELTVNNDLLLYGTRIVVPECLRKQTLTKVHQGIYHCCSRILSSVWWPGVTNNYQSARNQLHLNVRDQRVPGDLFELKGTNYIVVSLDM